LAIQSCNIITLEGVQTKYCNNNTVLNTSKCGLLAWLTRPFRSGLRTGYLGDSVNENDDSRSHASWSAFCHHLPASEAGGMKFKSKVLPHGVLETDMLATHTCPGSATRTLISAPISMIMLSVTEVMVQGPTPSQVVTVRISVVAKTQRDQCLELPQCR
jgi:hypothetical protein